MPNRQSKTGSELFIVNNSDEDWKALRYLHDWSQISGAIDIATGYFEIGALLGLKDEWQKVDQIRSSSAIPATTPRSRFTPRRCTNCTKGRNWGDGRRSLREECHP